MLDLQPNVQVFRTSEMILSDSSVRSIHHLANKLTINECIITKKNVTGHLYLYLPGM